METIKLVLPGQARSTQNCYRNTTANGYNRSYMKQVCVDLKETWQWAIRDRYKGNPLTCPVKMDMTVYHGTKRRVDVDNFNKLVFDALTGIVYEDDSLITELTVRKDYDPDYPRVVVTITPCAS